MKGRNAFPKTSRLRTSIHYQQVWKQGRRYQTAHFTAIISPNQQGLVRLGLTVSRKVGNAVCRNRLKRWLREFFRCHLGHLDRSLDISIIVKSRAGFLDHSQVKQELHSLMTRLEADVHD